MKSLRDWIAKLTGKKDAPPAPDTFTPTTADNLEEQQRLLKQDEEKSDHDPARYEG